MSAERFFIFLIISGVVLGFVGLFLPWAEWSLGPEFAGSFYTAGIGVPLGMFALVWWLAATVMLFMIWVPINITDRKLLLGYLMSGGIVTMVCSLASMVDAGVLLSSAVVYTASYGEYVSFAGGTLILVGAILSS